MKKNIIRNIIGGFFIFTGFVGMFSSGFWAGIFMMLFGISLLPIFYEKVKLDNIKHIQIILPIVLMIISVMVMPEATTETKSDINEVDTNVIQENKKIEITNLKFKESEIDIDIKESKAIVLEMIPENANIENLEFCTSNNQIATLEKSDIENTKNTVTLKIQPISEGNCEIFVKSINGIESNKVIVKIIDNERIEKEKKEAEEQAKKEAEEQAKKQAEEQAKKEAEEQAKKQSQSTTTQKNNSSSQTTSTPPSTGSSTSQGNSNNSHGKTVYRTPSGKRYHFDPDCGGKNSYSTTLDSAISAGLTPCQKCAK